MRRFTFRLQSVLEWRARRVEAEQARLQALHSELRSIERAIEAIDDERREAERTVALEGAELAALDRYRARAARDRARMAAARADCERRIERQRTVLLEAERGVALLERLKAKKLRDHAIAAERELENAAAEGFLARWKR